MGALAGAAARAGLFPGAPAIAARARDWLFGLNPWGVSFTARYGPSPPQGIHHWAIFRGCGLPRGAVVGGPAPLANIRSRKLKMPTRGRFARFNSASAAYDDNAANYVTSEPAIDYSATLCCCWRRWRLARAVRAQPAHLGERLLRLIGALGRGA